MANSGKSRLAERLVDILITLHLHGVVDRQTLMKKFNITERTVYRDLNTLPPIVGYCGDGQYRLIEGMSNRAGLGLHHSLATLLDADSVFPDRGIDFWQKLEGRLAEKNIIIGGNSAEHSVASDTKRYLGVIEKAIQNRSVCQLTYKGKNRAIHPYKLLNKKNIWYLQATEGGTLKSFTLSQISWFETKSQTFSANEKTLALLNKSPDPWLSEVNFMVTLFVSHSVSKYLKRRDLLPSQHIIQEDKNGITLTCLASHENQIIPLIFYWLPNIDVLEPAWLRSKVVHTLQNYITTVTAPQNAQEP
nr:WYL domain-containing protein [Plesiomonas shigelloides]